MQLNGLDYNDLLKEMEGRFSFFPSAQHFDKLSVTEPVIAPTIYLRHDIDDNIDAAVEMAKVECTMNALSTYYLLDTADYFYMNSSRKKMQMIQALGHEVGWHNNAITEWLKSGLPGTMLFSCIDLPLVNLRANGIEVRGTASHGDPMCYEKHYVNYEVWDQFPKKNNLPHPQYSLSKFGLEYEAYQFNKGWYLSDSGGKWNVEDPLAYIRKWKEEGDKPLQVLVHSQWWK